MFLRYRFFLFNSTKRFSLYLNRSSSNETVRFDPCTGCELPCAKHVNYPSEVLKQIDQGDMTNSVEKYQRHLVIGQSISSSQWPKDIKNLPGDYIRELARILQEKKEKIGHSIKVSLTSTDAKRDYEHTADWYLFPDLLKLTHVNVGQIEQVVEKLFIRDQSANKTRERNKSIESQVEILPQFTDDILYERLHGLWFLVCCHYQRDQRCGITGPILVDEIERYVRKTNGINNVHCLKISHIGGHRFAGNIIVYPSGTWYGRVSPCHIPLLIDAYTSSSKDLKEQLQPLLRGHLNTTQS